jgi:hypothetical protein
MGPVVAGEAWSDAARADLAAMEEPERIQWVELLNTCAKASGSTPTAKWLNATRPLQDQIGFSEFRRAVLKWFPLVDKPRTQRIEQRHQYAPDPNNLIDTPTPISSKASFGCVPCKKTKRSRAR